MKSKTTSIVKPTINQIRVSEIVKKKIREGKKVSIGSVMREVGYSDWYSKHPEKLTRSDNWKQLMKTFLNDNLLATTHYNLLVNKNWKARERGLEMAYKVTGKFKDQEDTDGKSIKNILLQVYNDNRQLISKENGTFKEDNLS